MSNAARKLSVMTPDDAARRAKPSPLGATQSRSPKATRTEPKVARSKASKKREEILSYFVGLGCIVGLFLSGIDSTLALNTFVHVPLWRAAMLAIVIDGLLVGGELATLFSPCLKVKKTSQIYIIMAGFLSVCLNSAEFASHGVDLAGQFLCGGVGAVIPILVLVSSRYAGYLYLSSK